MGKLIYLSEYMIPRPTIDDEIAKCDADLRMFGLCCMVDGRRVDPADVYNKERE